MTVGWYVHHHGAGHRHRLAATLPHLGDVVALSSGPPVAGCDRIDLPLDTGGEVPDETAGGTLHWAPAGHDGLRERMAAIAAFIRDERPAAMVVDVSVEVALLARLHGVPTVVVAQRGRRTDAPHALAYAQAAAVVAPWTAATHLDGDLPVEPRFTGAISRFDGTAFPAPAAGGDVLFLLGDGGHGVTAADVTRAAAATGRTWHVAGPLRVDAPGVVDHGPSAPVRPLLERCAVVVGAGGGNVVAEVAAARRPFVCLPQPRPFAEQDRQALALERLGVAAVHRAWPADWPATLADAESRDPARWSALHDGHGARRLAEAIQDGASRMVQA